VCAIEEMEATMQLISLFFIQPYAVRNPLDDGFHLSIVARG